jgi:hypothetical protein
VVRGLRLSKAWEHLVRKQLCRSFANMPGLAGPLAKKAKMKVVDAHLG